LKLSASTRVAGVIGDPVRHSLSPALHNAAYAALGLDWVYVAFPVPGGEGAAAVAAMRALGLAGLSVTMPHKAAVAAAVDQLTATATRLGVANTVSWAGDQLEGDSTDGDGFLDALRGDDGFDPAGRRCVVLGAGGAARAVTLALADAGAATIDVVARRAGPGEDCAALAGQAGRWVPADDVDGPVVAVMAADLVVNATPVGMGHDSDIPFGLTPEALRRDQWVVDLIYAPAVTPLLAAARTQGATTANGLGMLIHQAARQVGRWTGRPPPLEAMSAAALGALAHPVT
jgi:shikimate dehydrogenase